MEVIGAQQTKIYSIYKNVKLKSQYIAISLLTVAWFLW
jgi:hypothetical protein